MKKYICTLILSCLATAGRADIKFVGYGAFEGKQRYALCEDANSQAGWVAVGDGFCGYKVERFDSNREELWLSGTDGSFAVKLAYARVESAHQWDPAKKNELLATLHDMLRTSGYGGKLFQIADYISVATSYGLVIEEWRLNGTQEVIRMRNPVRNTSASVKKSIFSIQLKGHKDVPDRKLTVTITEANQAPEPTPMTLGKI